MRGSNACIQPVNAVAVASRTARVGGTRVDHRRRDGTASIRVGLEQRRVQVEEHHDRLARAGGCLQDPSDRRIDLACVALDGGHDELVLACREVVTHDALGRPGRLAHVAPAGVARPDVAEQLDGGIGETDPAVGPAAILLGHQASSDSVGYLAPAMAIALEWRSPSTGAAATSRAHASVAVAS